MKIEEAIKVLEKQFDKSCGNYRYQNAEKIDFEDAIWMAIEALKEKKDSEWISVEDRMPDMDGEYVVKVDGKTKPFVLSFGFFGSKKIGMWYDDDGIAYSGITHWKKQVKEQEEV